MSFSDSPIISVAIPRPVEGLFTYKISKEKIDQIRIGGWVTVPFGKRDIHAYVVELPKSIEALPDGLSPKALKEVLEVGNPDAVLPSDVFELCRWASDYYFAPIGEVLNSAAPASVLGLRSTKRESRTLSRKTIPVLQRPELTAEQKAAVEILSQSTGVCLLNGVTGSGKTEVYLERAREVLSKGQSCLILVPEIALTPQLRERFESGLGEPVALWHSALPDGQRRDLYTALLNGTFRIVVGARSAVFAPLQNLGLIVVDEEHDPTYKQEDRVRYHARDLAVVRGRIAKAQVILGSATPSLETLARVDEGKYRSAKLTQRVMAGGMPIVEFVDLKAEPVVTGTQAVLAERTVEKIRQTLSQNQQVLLFLNRRGFASFLVCEECGDVKNCPNCSISLTHHKKISKLKCHLCDYSEPIGLQCQKCLGTKLKPVGMGTEGLEEDIARLIPEAKISRLDRDQITSNTRLEKVLDEFVSGETNLLIGTQMLVKGHDFPHVTLVVVVLADGLFRWPDFRSQERALQVLKQVSGRAGRRDQAGSVLIQTYCPSHPVLRVLSEELSEEDFLREEKELRKTMHYSPYSRMARIRFESTHRKEAIDRAEKMFQLLLKEGSTEVELLGPSEAFQEKVRGMYRWDILIKSNTIHALHHLLLGARSFCIRNRWNFWADVDPYSS